MADETVETQNSGVEEVDATDSTSQQDATQDSSPASESGTAPAGEQAAKPETDQTEKDIGFASHPAWQKNRETIRDLRNQLGESRNMIHELKGQFQSFQTQAQPKSEPMMSQEQRTQQQSLAELRDLLGLGGMEERLGKLDQLEKANQTLTDQASTRAWGEDQQKLETMVKEDGLKPGETADDIADELKSFISQHPTLSKIQNDPGVYSMAYMLSRRSNVSENAMRQANKNLIDQQAKQKAANSEKPGLTPSGKKPQFAPGVSGIVEMIRQEGGIDNVDMNL